MASLYPAEFLGISKERGQIRIGSMADLALLNDKGVVQQCWLEGRPYI
jgi:N-acetylglucosamine-6-phosphate deacetylase